MRFEMSSERRCDEAVEMLYQAGYNAIKLEGSIARNISNLDVKAAGAEAEAEVLAIVTAADAGASQIGS